MCEFSKAVEDNKQKLYFCITNNDPKMKLKNKNTVILYNCLEMNSTKDMQNLYTENYKVLLTEIKEDLN